MILAQKLSHCLENPYWSSWLQVPISICWLQFLAKRQQPRGDSSSTGSLPTRGRTAEFPVSHVQHTPVPADLGSTSEEESLALSLSFSAPQPIHIFSFKETVERKFFEDWYKVSIPKKPYFNIKNKQIELNI